MQYALYLNIKILIFKYSNILESMHNILCYWILSHYRFRDIPVSGLLARADGAWLLLPVSGHGAGVRDAQRRVQHHQTVLPVGRTGGGRSAVRLAGVATAADRQTATDR